MTEYTDAQLFQAMIKFIQEDESVALTLAQYIEEGEAQQVKDFLGALIEERE